MIITGDIASPSLAHSEDLQRIFTENKNVFGNQILLCNFEGMVSDGINNNQNKPVLFNHPSVFKALKAGNIKVVGLANNHILDLPQEFDASINLFAKHEILYTGAAKSKEAAISPVLFYDKEKEVVFFNACWDFLLYHQKNPTSGVYISEIEERHLLQQVSHWRNTKPDSSIVLYFHWSIDLEKLPFPMYRQFSKSLIDAGANLVVGGHSHCVQGGEKHKNGYIIYGVGNFFMPHDVFAQGKIAYPEFSNTELVLEWDCTTNSVTCHWFKYNYNGKSHTLDHTGSEVFETSAILKEFSPYQGMDEDQYYAYFKKSRRKKILIPIYRDYNNTIINWSYTFLLKNRARISRFLAKNNLIKWQN